MTFQQELSSWFAPRDPPETSPPAIGSPAPQTTKLSFDQQPTILTFLRHCGCPFAEKTFLNFREAARANRSVNFIAVSHSSDGATQTWLRSLPQAGSEPDNLHVIVDEAREIYGAWGLGVAGYGHVLSPSGLYSVWKMGREEGIWNRPTESGSRWQLAGNFGVDAEGIVKWGGVAERMDEMPDFKRAVMAMQMSIGEKSKL